MQLHSFSHLFSFSVKGQCYCVAILVYNNVLVVQSVDKKFRSIGTCLLPVSSSVFFPAALFSYWTTCFRQNKSNCFRIKYKFYRQDAVNLSVSFCFTFLLRAFGLSFYRPQTKLREGYVFTGVCDSAHMGGWYPSMPCRSPGGCIPSCLAGFQAHIQGGA